MDGNPAAPPIAVDGREYTKAIFQNARARKKYFAIVKDENVRSTVLDVLRAICAILVNANRKRNYHLAVYRTAKALAELRDEFGEAKDFHGYDTVLAYVLGPPPPKQSARKRSPRDNQPIIVEDLAPKPISKQPSRKKKRR